MATRRWVAKVYSGLVFCKTRGNSGVTASTSRHWKPQRRNHHCGDDSILRVNVTRNQGLPCLDVVGGLDLEISGNPVHDLASAMGHEWLATCFTV